MDYGVKKIFTNNNDNSDSYWSIQYGYRYGYCSINNTSIIYSNRNGHWGIENNQWCEVSISFEKSIETLEYLIRVNDTLLSNEELYEKQPNQYKKFLMYYLQVIVFSLQDNYLFYGTDSTKRWL
ncbi:hypothetical protein BCR32DRAFT_278548 [Anaeromyces robustus]|uniref:CBM10 domain-containing protein n=1 Tax=Anaeromyces robustus TaxID=1754192 RepID=A0A1Y1XAQ8_9FUNG|nr:hypothetical protein BCR32DRAFT_278548 [Anaeromyces robustus]|eukprot:ORX82807.1 hypothetical protein BCR32DRAFT_278548 [Anaeromyces robustus]